MIKILHVVTYMGRGGLETMIMNYYRNIDRTKIQFDFLVHRDFKADYDDEIEAMGGQIHRISRLIPWSKKYRSELNNFFKTHPEYKIVHVHQDCLSSVILKVAKHNQVKIRIAHSHNSSQDKNLKYIFKLYYKQLIPKYATDLFACGEKAGKWMFNNHDFKIMNNAIDASKYIYNEKIASQIRKEFNISNDAFVIGHIGRFAKAKNHTFLLDIFKEFQNKHNNSYLLLIGDGQLRNEITNKIDALNLKNNVILTGVRSDVANLIQAMDVFVMPSLYEGLPVSLIEAQAGGIPCLICNHFSKDCDITDLVYRTDLNTAPSDWSKQIESLVNTKRSNKLHEIQKAGYDIKENARWLENYYLKEWNGMN